MEPPCSHSYHLYTVQKQWPIPFLELLAGIGLYICLADRRLPCLDCISRSKKVQHNRSPSSLAGCGVSRFWLAQRYKSLSPCKRPYCTSIVLWPHIRLSGSQRIHVFLFQQILRVLGCRFSPHGAVFAYCPKSFESVFV